MARCEFSYKKVGNDDTVRCRLLHPNGDCCGNVKFCRTTGHWENTENYETCPVRRRGQELQGGNEKWLTSSESQNP